MTVAVSTIAVSIFLSLYCISSFSLVLSTPSSHPLYSPLLWDKYKLAFGDRLLRSFSSLDTFLESNHQSSALSLQPSLHTTATLLLSSSTTFSPSSPDRKQRRIGCSEYLLGATIARSYRKSDADSSSIPWSLKPFIVDNAKNIMCFIIHEDASILPEVLDLFSFIHEIHDVLKVEPTVFAYVDELANYDDGYDSSDILKIYVLMNNNNAINAADRNGTTTNNNHYNNNDQVDAAEELFQSAIKLLDYNFDAFDNFFWTSPAAYNFFNNKNASTGIGNKFSAPKSNELDKIRYDSWNLRANYVAKTMKMNALKNLKSDEGTNTRRDLLQDTCRFRSNIVEKDADGISIRLTLGTNTIEDRMLMSSCIVYLVAYFASQPATWNIAIKTHPEVSNYRANSIIQSISNELNNFSNVPPTTMSMSKSPYSEAGLLGDGQIVGVADTGLDLNSCFFFDVDEKVTPSVIDAPVSDLSARKVVQYLYDSSTGDGLDAVSGHGSHVAGTIVGASPSQGQANTFFKRAIISLSRYVNNLFFGNTVAVSLEEGENTGSTLYNGIAPNAKISFVDLSLGGGGIIALDPPRLYEAGYRIGVRIFSNSWGTSYREGGHYAGSVTDQYLYDHPDVAIIFAAGNDGAGGKKTISSEGQLKNVIAVGSSKSTNLANNDIDSVSWFSSRGPSFDNRIKPDIIAPGESLESAKASGLPTSSSPSDLTKNPNCCDTTLKSGTSMAAPIVAATALLVRQYLIDPGGIFWTKVCRPSYFGICKSIVPSGVLIKASVLHSGTSLKRVESVDDYYSEIPLDSNNLGPDNYQGYGRLSLQELLPLPGRLEFDLFFDDLQRISEDSSMTYFVDIYDTSRPLKVTLAWYDPPGIDGLSTQALIHNLDLLIESPESSIAENIISSKSPVSSFLRNYNGKNKNSSSGSIRSNSSNVIAASTKLTNALENDANFTKKVYFGNHLSMPDSVNNNEQITVEAPQLGRWTVTVQSNALPVGGMQAFSIVITSLGEVSSEQQKQK